LLRNLWEVDFDDTGVTPCCLVTTRTLQASTQLIRPTGFHEAAAGAFTATLKAHSHLKMLEIYLEFNLEEVYMRHGQEDEFLDVQSVQRLVSGIGMNSSSETVVFSDDTGCSGIPPNQIQFC
jgi:hypothetical protein